MLNELCLWEAVPTSAPDKTRLRWTKRHCLRSADSALLLPKLYLFHDGHSLRAEWQADDSDSMPNMPGEFIADGVEQLNAEDTQESFAQFISDVLSRVAGVKDDRIDELSNQWRAIQGADDEEREFCTLAGRMGIDPYDPNEMTDSLALFLEQSTAIFEEPLFCDLTEVARPDSIEQQGLWINDASLDLGLGPNSVELPFELPSRRLSPPEFGYHLARKVRETADIESAPLSSVEEACNPWFMECFVSKIGTTFLAKAF